MINLRFKFAIILYQLMDLIGLAPCDKFQLHSWHIDIPYPHKHTLSYSHHINKRFIYLCTSNIILIKSYRTFVEYHVWLFIYVFEEWKNKATENELIQLLIDNRELKLKWNESEWQNAHKTRVLFFFKYFFKYAKGYHTELECMFENKNI